jgi:hypothetical protein
VSNYLAQVINFVLLAAVVSLSLWFVGRDARKRGLPWLEAAGWTAISTFTFPLGFGLYFLWRPGGVEESHADGVK